MNLNNVMVVKSILRYFELAFDLKVNFFKSRYGGLGLWKKETLRDLQGY